jgi:phytoene synthase
MGRLYLPREALRDAGIISTDPRTVLAHPLIEQPCNLLVALAIGEFEAANAVMAQAPRRSIRAPRIMGQAYRLILNRLIARGFEPPRTAVRLPRAKILLIVLRNVI